ncbi:MAG: tetratricopeptide repeat protein [Candidatus Midichloria sp.]|nr:tetratricopeptide repeat protein [Candidatus Midichloria sp.]
MIELSAFEKFIKNNPNNFNKQEYDKAAVEYLKGYQVRATSVRAPDNLLKLAESLFKLGKRQECCVTIAKLNKEFPNISISIKRSANLSLQRMRYVIRAKVALKKD